MRHDTQGAISRLSSSWPLDACHSLLFFLFFREVYFIYNRAGDTIFFYLVLITNVTFYSVATTNLC